jgi:hypothetical protein
MPKVADYSIIADGELKSDKVTFNIPSNIDKNSRCILSFMLRVKDLHDLDSVKVILSINAKNVWSHRFYDPRYGSIQEVIPKNLLKPGSNQLDIDYEWGDPDALESLTKTVFLSDIVVFWQAVVGPM